MTLSRKAVVLPQLIPEAAACLAPLQCLPHLPSPYLGQCLRLQGLVIAEAAVAGGERGLPHRKTLSQILPIGIVDASGAAEGGQPPLLWALHPAPVDGDLMGAAGAGGSPWWGVNGRSRPPDWAVCIATAPTALDGGTVRP